MKKLSFLIVVVALVTNIGVLQSVAKDQFRDCGDCPEMVVLPAGKFILGSNQYPSEMPITPVVIPKPFAIGKFEVTFDQWAACVNDNGCQSNPHPGDNGGKDARGQHPVIFIKWAHAQEYIDWLNDKVKGSPYRLPSEAEWEYAARAGQTSKMISNYSWGNEIDCDKASFGGSPGGECFVKQVGDFNQNRPVGSYKANAYGLHDMHGNVAEWVEDCWHYGYKNLPEKSKKTGAAWAQDACTFRVVRGGSTVSPPWHLRTSNRSRLGAVNKERDFGFRVARSLP